MNIFFTADTHFNHKKVITFEPSHRPFSTIEEHDEELIKRWNDRVRPKDIIWHLGDVYFGKTGEGLVDLMRRLNGKKNLIRGNYDTLDTAYYATVFDEIYGVFPKYGFVMSHVPLHPDSVERWGVNVHGHRHSEKVRTFGNSVLTDPNFRIDRSDLPDPAYYCVSVEQTNLAPISLDELRLRIKGQHQ